MSYFIYLFDWTLPVGELSFSCIELCRGMRKNTSGNIMIRYETCSAWDAVPSGDIIWLR